VETHLVLSRWGARTLIHETPFTVEQVRRMATRSYAEGDQGRPSPAGPSSPWAWWSRPAASRPWGAIAHGHGTDLVHRAADVVLKERRRLVLAVRESPLSEIHLENISSSPAWGS